MSEHNQASLRPVSMADSEKTAAQSVNPSFVDNKEVDASIMPSEAQSTREQSVEPETVEPKQETSEKTPEEKAASAEEDDDFEYPTKWRLTVITIALCLSVFCMALVSISCCGPFGYKSANPNTRTTLSSRLRSPASQISSKP